MVGRIVWYVGFNPSPPLPVPNQEKGHKNIKTSYIQLQYAYLYYGIKESCILKITCFNLEEPVQLI